LGDIELPGEDERLQFDAYLEKFRSDEVSFAESRVIGNFNITGDNLAGEDGQAQMAQFHLPIQCKARLGFELGAKPIHIDQKRQGNQHKKNDSGRNRQNEHYALFHVDNTFFASNVRTVVLWSLLYDLGLTCIRDRYVLQTFIVL
jgi:hypothetical protein